MSKIVTAPSPILRQIAKPVVALDKKIQKIVDDMIATLLAAKNPEGVGLAAPQIGVPLRIFMIRPQSGGSITTFINPEIITYSQALQSPKKKGGIYEGCLSLPGHYSPVTRSLSVTVKYQKLDARLYTPTPVQETFSGFAAHIIQHEADHLNGILFIDRVLEQNIPLYKIEGNTWTEISL